jgi:hypothetical protein
MCVRRLTHTHYPLFSTHIHTRAQVFSRRLVTMEKCEPFSADKQLVPRGPGEPEPVWASLKEVDIKTQAQKKRKNAPSRYKHSYIHTCVKCVVCEMCSILLWFSCISLPHTQTAIAAVAAAAVVAIQPRSPRGARRGRSAGARSKH